MSSLIQSQLSEVGADSDDATLIEAIKYHHGIASNAGQALLQYGIECGRLLSEAKRRVKHGEWHQWLESNTQISIRTVQRYMQLFAYRDRLLANPEPLQSIHDALSVISKPNASSTTHLTNQPRSQASTNEEVAKHDEAKTTRMSFLSDNAHKESSNASTATHFESVAVDETQKAEPIIDDIRVSRDTNSVVEAESVHEVKPEPKKTTDPKNERYKSFGVEMEYQQWIIHATKCVDHMLYMVDNVTLFQRAQVLGAMRHIVQDALDEAYETLPPHANQMIDEFTDHYMIWRAQCKMQKRESDSKATK